MTCYLLDPRGGGKEKKKILRWRVRKTALPLASGSCRATGSGSSLRSLPFAVIAAVGYASPEELVLTRPPGSILLGGEGPTVTTTDRPYLASALSVAGNGPRTRWRRPAANFCSADRSWPWDEPPSNNLHKSRFARIRPIC